MKRLTCTLLLAMILLTMPWATVPAMARGTYFEVLLIGEDDAPLDTVQAGEHPNGRADALMLLSLCLDDGAMKLVSIERHLVCDVPGAGKTKLCIANYLGGPTLQLQMVNQTFEMAVPYYALVNKAGMGRVVDVVGGVELDVQADETSIRLSDGQLAFADAGLQWASGAQAVAYMDSREMDDDTQRNRRQRAVLDAILHKLSGGMRLSEALALGTELLSLVKTNVGFAEVLQAGMALIQKGYERPEQLRTPEKWVSRGVNFHIVAVADDMNAEIRRLKEFLYGKEEAS